MFVSSLKSIGFSGVYPARIFVVFCSVTLAGCNTSSYFSKQGIASLSNTANSTTIKNTSKIRPAETIADGTFSVGLISGALGKKIDEGDRHQALNAEFDALEYSPAGSNITWISKTSGNHGIITPSQTYDVGNLNCRQYTHTIYIDNKPKSARGTACKERDGVWQLSS